MSSLHGLAPQNSWLVHSRKDVPSWNANCVCPCSAGAHVVDPLDCIEILGRGRASPDGNLA